MDPKDELRTSQSLNQHDPGFWDEQLVRAHGPTPTLRTIIQWYKCNQPKMFRQTQEELQRLSDIKEIEKRVERTQEREEHKRQRKFWMSEGRKQKQAHLELQLEIKKQEIKKLKAQLRAQRLPPGSMVLNLGTVRLAELEQLAFAQGMEPLECLGDLITDATRRMQR
jgi:hypothetical protein